MAAKNSAGPTGLEIALSVAGIVVGIAGTAATLYAAHTLRFGLSRRQLTVLAALDEEADGQGPPLPRNDPSNRMNFERVDFRARKR